MPGADLAPLREIDIEDAWSLPGEDARIEIELDWPVSDEEESGAECWILTLTPPALALLNEADEHGAFTTDAAHIAIGKDTGYWRGVYLAVSIVARDNMPMTVDVRLPIIATDIQTEDADFAWRTPAGANAINWAPGSARKAIGGFRAALDPRMAEYRRIEASIRAAVEAGEITKEQATEKLNAARRETWADRARGGGR